MPFLAFYTANIDNLTRMLYIFTKHFLKVIQLPCHNFCRLILNNMRIFKMIVIVNHSVDSIHEHETCIATNDYYYNTNIIITKD